MLEKTSVILTGLALAAFGLQGVFGPGLVVAIGLTLVLVVLTVVGTVRSATNLIEDDEPAGQEARVQGRATRPDEQDIELRVF